MTTIAPVQYDEDALVTHCIAGMNAQNAGRMKDAVTHFSSAVQVAPSNLDVRLMLAYAQGAAADKASASETLLATPSIHSLAEADARRLCDAATELEAWRAARYAVEQLLVFSPREPDLHSTLGALHHKLGDLTSASLVLHRAHTRWPTHVPTMMNRARLLSETGEHAEALALYDEVIRRDPSHAAARWYRGMVRLLLGQFEEGWFDHEARRSLPFMEVITPAGIPAWQGESLAGKTVLLWGEQGLGDQIMGARSATVLAERGARVVVRCHASLVPVMKQVEGVSLALANDAELPLCDVHVPMLSVPYLAGLSGDVGAAGRAYVRPAGEPSLRVRELLGSQTNVCTSTRRRRVGIVWAGSGTHGNDHNRSFPAEFLSHLLNGANVEWVSLQLGERRADLETLDVALRSRVIDASNAIEDFNDTAHIVSSCDMVVTVDTSVAHLSGAIGVSTIVMLPYVPDWRWQVARRDTPWYASVRLVRQPMAGSWEHVVAEVHRAVNSGSV